MSTSSSFYAVLFGLLSYQRYLQRMLPVIYKKYEYVCKTERHLALVESLPLTTRMIKKSKIPSIFSNTFHKRLNKDFKKTSIHQVPSGLINHQNSLIEHFKMSCKSNELL